MTAQAPNPPSLAHYLRVLRGGAWIILLSLGVTTAAAYYFSSRQEKLYRASADVYLNTQNLAYALSNVTLPSVDDPLAPIAVPMSALKPTEIFQRS